MSFERWNATSEEVSAITKGWTELRERISDVRAAEMLTKEVRGYGVASQRVPLVAAKGLCLQWYSEGRDKPDMLLRRTYFCRPAAIWFLGKGAYDGELHGPVKDRVLTAAVAAYQAAFKRMIAADMDAVGEAIEGATGQLPNEAE